MMKEMLWLVPLLVGSVYADKYCKRDHFYNITSAQCQLCSKCLNGELLKRKCSQINDTLCGLINFSFYEPKHLDQKTKEVTPTVLADDDEKYWKTLAFALIGLLSFLVIVTSLIVFVTCYKFRHIGWFCKHVTPEQEDMENGYVVIHKFIPDSSTMSSNSNYSNPSSAATSANESRPLVFQPRGNKPYRPKRRLMNEYVDDDVFESDDSGGSRSLRGHLETIPERGESS